jgi:hypothetical protein
VISSLPCVLSLCVHRLFAHCALVCESIERKTFFLSRFFLFFCFVCCTRHHTHIHAHTYKTRRGVMNSNDFKADNNSRRNRNCVLSDLTHTRTHTRTHTHTHILGDSHRQSIVSSLSHCLPLFSLFSLLRSLSSLQCVKDDFNLLRISSAMSH